MVINGYGPGFNGIYPMVSSNVAGKSPNQPWKFRAGYFPASRVLITRGYGDLTKKNCICKNLATKREYHGDAMRIHWWWYKVVPDCEPTNAKLISFTNMNERVYGRDIELVDGGERQWSMENAGKCWPRILQKHQFVNK